MANRFQLEILPSDFQFESESIESDLPCCGQCNDVSSMEFTWLQHPRKGDQDRMPDYLIKLRLEDITKQPQSEGFNLDISLADDIMSIDDISSASVSNLDLPMEVAEVIFDVLRECCY